jgi:predicted nucleic acid-binding protein
VKIYSNTTPLLAFASIERFDILQAVHGQIHVVDSVWQECQCGIPIVVPDLAKLDWVHLVGSPRVVDGRFLALDAGERDTISEALSDKADLVLIDERLGRNLAEYYGLRVVGTLGTLLKAKKMGVIPEFLPTVRALQDHGFWYAANLVRRLANDVGE